MKTPDQIWQRSGKDLLDTLESGPGGLTSHEAARRLERYGPNELREGGKKSTFRIFLEQFADFLVIILILAAVVSAVLGDVESTVVILAVITMNAVLGTVQTVKAEASLDRCRPPRRRFCGMVQWSKFPAGRLSRGISWCWRQATPSVPTAACWNVPA